MGSHSNNIERNFISDGEPLECPECHESHRNLYRVKNQNTSLSDWYCVECFVEKLNKRQKLSEIQDLTRERTFKCPGCNYNIAPGQSHTNSELGVVLADDEMICADCFADTLY